jgi:serine/threonine protein kinase
MLTSGTKLGPYEIVAPLGSGGMGEVYRARDTRLDRDVAVKVLPANLSSDANLRQRLEREAKAVSRLSHPHICTLHDIGHHDGRDFLVMELVEGETLETRLIKGPLPPDQTIRIATQIADALAKAHKLGITHRDLKPSNVMLTKSGAKLMDFGLAKQSGPAPLAQALTQMTAEQAKLTSEGMLVGTFQYMAPEQLEGKEADARADIFALGELIYEMVTGKPAFTGKSRASLIAAILTTDPPPITQLQRLAPPALERVVRKCLAKDPDDRWQSASDLASELKWITESGSQPGVALTVPAPSKWARIPWLVAAASLLMLATGAFSWWKSSHRQMPPSYFQAAIPFPATDLALSPNGRAVAMVAYSAQVNNYALWTYDVGGRHPSLIDGTAGAAYPFWSPDNKSIAFFSEGKLKKVDAAGGPVQVLCDAPNGRGGAWNREGTIIFAADALGGLSRVSSWGGAPTGLTQPDAARSESGHRWPVFLPDQKHYLYLAANFSARPGINALFIGALDSTEKHFLVNSSANAIYVEPGYLLYLRDKTLVAQPLDLKKFALTGEPRTLNDEVLYFPQVYRAVFDASPTALVTQIGKGVYLSELGWFDRTGRRLSTVGKPTWYDNLQISPDGRRVATDQTDPGGRNTDVYILDPSRDTSTRLTFDPALDMTPVWNADSKRVVFTSNRSLDFRLYLKNADGSGSDQEVAFAGGAQFNGLDWSLDGKFILLRRTNELWYLAWPESTPKPLIQVKAVVRNAQFSPDGQWIAYSSNDSGRMEVYVTPFPSVSAKWQVSTNGGMEPRWRRDGKELFFLAPDATIMACPVTIGNSFESGSPVALFQAHRRIPISSQDLFSYDVSADGQRFLIAIKIDDSSAAPLSIVLNWASGMEK